MPITAEGIAETVAKNMLAAKAEVSRKWEEKVLGWTPRRSMTAAEQKSMIIEMETAALTVLFAAIAANLQVTILPTAVGLQTGVASGPTLGPAAPVPLPPGSIS